MDKKLQLATRKSDNTYKRSMKATFNILPRQLAYYSFYHTFQKTTITIKHIPSLRSSATTV